MKMDSIRFGVLIALLAVLLALLALIPEKWIGVERKFYLGLLIVIVVIAVLFLKSIFEGLQEYRKTKEEMGYVPRSIKYEKYRREHYIDPKTGDAEITYDLKATNIGSDNIGQISVPISFQLTRTGKRGGRSPLDVKQISVNNHKIANPQECYKRDCIKKLEIGEYAEEGKLQIPLERIGRLKKGDKCTILIQMILSGAFKNVKESDWVGVDIHHQMEVLEVIVSLKNKLIIQIFKNQEIPDGINIYDTILNVARPTETAQVSKPVIRGNVLSWVIKKPKLSYFYKLCFRATRIKKT